MPPSFFFLGKGGVGKSTSSALTALALAKEGRKVLLVSLDPAHNQCDIFQRELSDRPRKVAPNLSAVEVEQEGWIQRYLSEVEERIHESYRYLTAFNLEKYFRVLRHSPGLEEHALIMAFESILERFTDADALVFDMAPTALSLKFFNLPSLTLVWAHHLLELRREIMAKREIITRVRLLDREIETDRVQRRLDESIGRYTELKRLFEDPRRTRITLVTNPDQLSLAESVRIAEGLEGLGIRVERVLVNKVTAAAEPAVEGIRSRFPHPELVTVPRAEQPLVGLPALEAFLNRGRFPVPSL